MLFSNDIFASFIDYWKDKNMPRDELAADWLIRTRGVLEKDAGPLWRVMKANIQAFGLNENVSGRTHIASRETALENVEESGPAEGISGPEVQASEGGDGHKVDRAREADIPAARDAASFVMGGTVTPQIHFNIQIQIPENGSPEVYDAIFKSIGTYLLGRKDEQ